MIDPFKDHKNIKHRREEVRALAQENKKSLTSTSNPCSRRGRKKTGIIHRTYGEAYKEKYNE